ncbi:MAG: hypothetical protein E6H09_10565 [Bacteroidetes bacterium]|jgi:hypothetical protein|nr:MAG: hypothetical protein E6H09_10565 [Bacteroidota bacterium]
MSFQAVKDYFNLSLPVDDIEAQGKKNLGYVLQYFFLVLGITAQPFIDKFRETGNWEYSPQYLIGRTTFGILIGLALFPAVYRRSWDQSHPIFIQLCTIFSAGIGWQSLIAAGVDASKVAS